VENVESTPPTVRDLLAISAEEGEKEAQLTLKTCVELDELLLQHMLALDMVCGGGDCTRTLRKAQVGVRLSVFCLQGWEVEDGGGGVGGGSVDVYEGVECGCWWLVWKRREEVERINVGVRGRA
jgi:BAG domain